MEVPEFRGSSNGQRVVEVEFPGVFWVSSSCEGDDGGVDGGGGFCC